MRINHIYIKNYRCFESLDISLDEHLTLFVGKNGAGKSTVLDAAAVAVSTFLMGIDGAVSRSIRKEDAKYNFYEMENIVDPQHQFPVVITGHGECDGNSNLQWSRTLNSASGKTTHGNAIELINTAKKLHAKIMAGNTEVILPLISYYGTGRLYAQKKEKKENESLQMFNRQIGYQDCMAAESNEKMMLNWFEKMTLKSLQMQQKTGILEKSSQLKIVEEAICCCFKEISGYMKADLFFDLDTHRIMIEYTEEETGAKRKFALNEMSDGYKNTLSMIGDIAYRMAVLNPQLGEKILVKTPGIVLIDEVDLHLHPQWQQTILGDLQRIFPKIQFIVTSHAPAVINSVKQENIRILDTQKAFIPSERTYGRDANSILREVMQVEERPAEVSRKFKAFYDAIDTENLKKAEDILNEVAEIVGENDPELNGARTTLELEKVWEEEL